MSDDNAELLVNIMERLEVVEANQGEFLKAMHILDQAVAGMAHLARRHDEVLKQDRSRERPLQEIN